LPITISRISCALIAAVIGCSTAGGVAAEAPGVATPAVAAAGANELEGFSTAAAAAQLQLEARFDADLKPAELAAWMQQMASQPNHVGSAHDKANAEFQLAKFREWGWDASIEEFSVLYPTPREVSVELVAPPQAAPSVACAAVAAQALAAPDHPTKEKPAWRTSGTAHNV
jgi:N-acetylated-alpha-linked acidic dipeptidase